jgi:large subunit ribosomal protein L35
VKKAQAKAQVKTRVKMKTNSSAKKRFTVTGGKVVKIKRGKAYRRHLMTRANAKTNRQLRQPTYFTAADLPRIKLLLLL